MTDSYHEAFKSIAREHAIDDIETMFIEYDFESPYLRGYFSGKVNVYFSMDLLTFSEYRFIGNAMTAAHSEGGYIYEVLC